MLSLLLMALTFPFSLLNPFSACNPKRGGGRRARPRATNPCCLRAYASMSQMSWAYSRMVRSLEK